LAIVIFEDLFRMARHTLKRKRSNGQPNTVLLPGSSVCHPRYKSRSVRSCLTQKHIRTIANSVNSPVKGGRKLLEERLGCRKDDELCLLKKSGLSNNDKKEIEEFAFRPKMPQEWKENMSTWLSDDDIRKVMEQYEVAYPEFKFLEVVPIDFSAPDPYKADGKTCIVNSFCHVDFKELKSQGKTKIAAVFNLDPHYKSGSHWVALFIDIPKHQVNYFDSYGLPPPFQIAKFMRSLTLQDKSLKLNSNARRFQYKGSECGMYSIVFILKMLTGVPFKKFIKNPISDDEVQAMRMFLCR
jgi:hypothetical protein